MIRMNKRQTTRVNVQSKLLYVSAELYFRSDKSRHFGGAFRSMMKKREVLRHEVLPCQHAANSQCSKHAKLNLMSVGVPWNARVTQVDNEPVPLSISEHEGLVVNLAVSGNSPQRIA